MLNAENLTSQDLISWINLHLSMNDLIYPVTMHVITTNNPVTASPSLHRTGGGDPSSNILSNPNASAPTDLETNKELIKGNPQKVITSVATLSRFSPTLINSNQTTLIHVATLGPSRSSSFRRINRSHDYTVLANSSINNLDNLFTSTNTTNLSDQLLKMSFQNRPVGLTVQHSHHTDYDSEMDSASVHEYGMSSDLVEFDTNTRALVNNSVNSPMSPTAQKMFSPREHREGGANLSPQREDKQQHPLPPSSDTSTDSVSKSLESNFNKASTDLTAANTTANAGISNFMNTASSSTSFFNTSFSNFANSFTAATGSNFKPDISLPQLFVNYSHNSKYYFISPYYSATITGCIKCEMIIGSVFGATILSGCEKLKITVTCRKLIVLNCVDCEIFLATASPTIFSGDCRNVTVGPVNATYRNYRHHLKLTELKVLIKSNNSLANTAEAKNGGSDKNNGNGYHPYHDDPVNQWARFCDVNACLDGGNKLLTSNALNTAMSPTKLSMKKVFVDNLPVPTASTARIMSVDKFHVVSIPIKSEFLSFEVRFECFSLPNLLFVI
jgi:hypothetical protein